MQPPSRGETPTSRPTDRRTRLRFDMNLPVLLRTFAQPWKAGELTNIGTKGAFVLINDPLLLKVPVECMVRLPPVLTKAKQPLMIRFVGTVVRCEARQEGDFSFGAAFESRNYKYLPVEDAARFDVLFQHQSKTAKE
jgi:hypothetical protein